MTKGSSGYLDRIKKKDITKCIIQWCIVIAFLIIGFLMTNTRLNLFTLFAVLSCLPAAKSTVAVIVKRKYYSLDVEKVNELNQVSEHCTVSYDMIFASKESLFYVDVLAISQQTIYGYISSDQVSKDATSYYIDYINKKHEFTSVKVKLFKDYKQFISRVDGMNRMREIDKAMDTEFEQELKRTLLLYCM